MLRCPECDSEKLFKAGLRHLKYGRTIQRHLCRECGYRFCDSQLLKTKSGKGFTCQVGAKPSPRRVKNLIKVDPPKDGLAGATKDIATIKGKLVEYAWWMNKQGYAKTTIRGHISGLRTLFNRGAELYNSESVKDIIARQKWSPNRKRNVINAYTLFLKFNGLQWEKPKCKITRKIPFIPTEKELDTLIAGCGKKLQHSFNF